MKAKFEPQSPVPASGGVGRQGPIPEPTETRAASVLGNPTERLLFWAFVAGLAWCPFWFGSSDLTAWGINAVVFPGLAVVYEISILVRGTRHPVGIKAIQIPAALFAAVVFWIVIQNATWTPPSLQHPIWQMTADALERPVIGSISVNRDLTSLALLRLITAASVFWLALQLCRNPSRAHLLLRAIAIIGAAYAAYGLIAFAATPGYVLWLPTMFSKGYVTSTFVNHNSFATYAGIGLIAVCGLILRLYRREVASPGSPLQFKIASFIEVTGKRGAFLLSVGFLILAALLLSGSRGGIIATALGLFAFGALSFEKRKKNGSTDQREIIVFVALLVGAAFLAFGDVFVGKIAQQGLRDENRLSVYAITLGSILDNPVLGYGYGTFSDVFPMFRDRSISVQGKWTMAHNTYLEVFQGLGLIFGSILLTSVGFLVFYCLKGAAARQTSATAPAVATGVAFLVGVHSLVDFSLQIQAVALTFMSVLGAGVAQSKSSRLVVND
jgi:O-antigen ligase